MPVVSLHADSVLSLPYVGHGATNRQCIYWDTTLPNFGVRVYPSGRRAYVCTYRIHGHKRLDVLGRVETLTKILSFTPTQLRVGAVPTALSVALQLNTASSRHRHYFKRDALHELVWTALFQKLRSSSECRTLRWRSCVDGRQYRHRDGATGHRSNPVDRCAEHRCRWRQIVCHPR
jgi:hypothetical protein